MGHRSLTLCLVATAAILTLGLPETGNGASKSFSSSSPSPPLAVPRSWPPSTGTGPCAVSKQANVGAVMRDGTILRADLYRPATDQPVPVILMRTQYGKDAAQVDPFRFQSPAWFASHCFLVVIQDVRGQYASGGVFYEYAHDGADGYDTVEWAAGLPGSNGRVGMYGSSYVGATQWLAAVEAPPHLVTIVPSNTSSDYYQGWTYEDGSFRLGFIEPWMMETIALSAARNRGDTKAVAEIQEASKNAAKWLHYRPYLQFPPLRPNSPIVAPYFFDAIRHSSYDDYWKRWAIKSRYQQVRVPVLHFEGWYDAFLDGGLENFAGMVSRGGGVQARQNQRIVIGPWDHLGWGRPGSPVSPLLKQIGPIANSPVNELMLAWFDHFLKGVNNGVSPGPTVNYFEMGANRWRSTRSWPPPGIRYSSYRLSSGGHANTLVGDGRLSPTEAASGPPDTYTYLPWDPVPSVGGHSCCSYLGGPQGQYDQGPVEQRHDVLVYTSPPLVSDMEVAGPISVTLYASSSAPDTDFTAKLVAVRSDGSAINLNNGIQTARFRASLERPTPIAPGRIYRYRIHIWPTSYLFRPGERVRLEISSSDFPQFAPNPNTGEPLGASARWQPGVQAVHHDAAHPSELTLPVVPSDSPGIKTSSAFPLQASP